jgi:prephenate dehydrogenase
MTAKGIDMTVQITIIGMGQIGTSVGLALSRHSDLMYRVGHDKEISISRKAEKMGALDRVDINIPHAVEQADIVLLALPHDQIQEMLRIIAPHLKADAVVMDTAPIKKAVADWAQELLPKGSHYVGLTPMLNPLYLHEHDSGTDAARADLFHNGMVAIITPSGTASEAIKLAIDLIHLLDSEHLFVDPVELDSLMAAVHLLPQLMAAALLNTTVDQPGWREGRKFAGRPYAEATAPSVHLGEPEALASAAMHAQEHLVRVIDRLIASLYEIRTDINNQDQSSLMDQLKNARSGREGWWNQRWAAHWSLEETAPSVEMPTAKDMMGRMVGLRRSKEEKKDK